MNVVLMILGLAFGGQLLRLIGFLLAKAYESTLPDPVYCVPAVIEKPKGEIKYEIAIIEQPIKTPDTDPNDLYERMRLKSSRFGRR